MIATLRSIVVDCPDPPALARFYQEILGWGNLDDGSRDWVVLTSPEGVRLVFQESPDHRPSTWPDQERPQQFHLDLDAGDLEGLDRKQEQVVALGARFLRAEGDEKAGFRVFADPAGHPFCLVYGAGLPVSGS
jgi:catechol 2,3-dioxygenase-like lactoylglutathione lyase family enzyme